MTKAEWISVIQKTMMKIDEQRIYAPQLIERHIQSVYEQMYNELYASNPRSVSQNATWRSEVLATTDIGTDGATMTVIPISLPRIGGGVFGVRDSTAAKKELTLTSYEGFINSKESYFDTAGLKGRNVAYIARNTVYSDITTDIAPFIQLRMIPKFTSLESTEEVMIPGGAEDHFIDRVIDTIRHMTPVDLFNDNTAQ